jgi:hypothetical protein
MIAALATVRGEVDRKTFGSKTTSDEIRELSVVFNNEKSHATGFNQTEIRTALAAH